MRQLRLATTDERVLNHSREAIYDVLCDVGSYHEWWPRMGDPRALGPLPVRIGTTLRLSYGPFVHWTAEVAELREPALIAMRYAGDLRGNAWWRLVADHGAGTRVAYEIDIEPVPTWLQLVSALWNLQPKHSRQIRRVFEALDRRVSAMTARDADHVSCLPSADLPDSRKLSRRSAANGSDMQDRG